MPRGLDGLVTLWHLAAIGLKWSAKLGAPGVPSSSWRDLWIAQAQDHDLGFIGRLQK